MPVQPSKARAITAMNALVALLALAILSPASLVSARCPTGVANLISNGDFEEAVLTSVWHTLSSHGGSVTIATNPTDTDSGDQALRLNVAATDASTKAEAGAFHAPVFLSEGTYSFSANVHKPADAGALELVLASNAGPITSFMIGDGQTTADQPDQWVTYSHDFTAEPGHHAISVHIKATGGADAGAIYVDGVSLCPTGASAEAASERSRRAVAGAPQACNENLLGSASSYVDGTWTLTDATFERAPGTEHPRYVRFHTPTAKIARTVAMLPDTQYRISGMYRTALSNVLLEADGIPFAAIATRPTGEWTPFVQTVPGAAKPVELALKVGVPEEKADTVAQIARAAGAGVLDVARLSVVRVGCAHADQQRQRARREPSANAREEL
ncbi:hypothetical protein GGF31_005770 [Allomyces arbusculus]|nr:hypothetical protein GGF31_005770 [Allomyces arbusculus]